jgi:hypothetical protein
LRSFELSPSFDEHVCSRLQMTDPLLELREQADLASCARRYGDVLEIYKMYLYANGDVPPMDRPMLYDAYNKLILDYNFKSYWKLTSAGLNQPTDLKYLETVEREIDRLCNEIVELIDHYFLASKLNGDLDTVISLRQRADFLFFNASIARPGTRQIMLQSALRSYTEGNLSEEEYNRSLFAVPRRIFRCRTISVEFTDR